MILLNYFFFDPNFLSIAEKFLFFRDKIGIIWILWEELIEENEEHHLLHRNTKNCSSSYYEEDDNGVFSIQKFLNLIKNLVFRVLDIFCHKYE